MKMTLTINEEFGDPAALIDFAHRVKVLMAMPSDVFQRLAGALAGAAALQQNSHPAASERTRAESPAEWSAGVTPRADLPSNHEVKAPNGENVGGAAPVVAVSTPPLETAAHSPKPPADVTPRARRGRPSNAERTAAEAPKAQTGGAAGVAADVVAPPAPETKHPLHAAVDAGAAEAAKRAEFQKKVLPHVALNDSGYRALLKEFGVTSGAAVPEDRREEFLAELAKRIPLTA